MHAMDDLKLKLTLKLLIKLDKNLSNKTWHFDNLTHYF